MITLDTAGWYLRERVKNECRNTDDVSTALSILTSYCSVNGYTETYVPTTIATTTGAYDAVTETGFVHVPGGQVSAASTVSPGASMALVATIFGTGVIAFVVPFVWLLSGLSGSGPAQTITTTTSGSPTSTLTLSS
ncbi:hypothetical protein VTJ04DRAFT_4756 [Mycothermus thermophilus]|uniref:uncharacterized protein n=1 Tax=Humicola insolens TaxID=85995 RepID=UPI003742B92D